MVLRASSIFAISPTVSKATNNSAGLSGPFKAESVTGNLPTVIFRSETDRLASAPSLGPPSQIGSLNCTVLALAGLALPQTAGLEKASIRIDTKRTVRRTLTQGVKATSSSRAALRRASHGAVK